MSAFFSHRANALAAAVLALLGAAALGADVLASDLPLALAFRGHTFLLPCLARPPELRAETNATLGAALGPGEWALFPPIRWGPEEPDRSAEPLAPPSAAHLLGTDGVGLDVASRLVHGARVSLGVGLVSVAISLVVGVLLGALAGFYGGTLDAVVSRFTEVVLVFPTFFFVLTVLGVLERGSLAAVMVVLGLTRWTDVQRLVRAETLRVRELGYVAASRALGATDLRLLVRHVVPNALGPVYPAATFSVAGAILIEASLSFLGFGAPPPTASWGALLGQGYDHAGEGAWWLTLAPGLAIFATVAAWNLLGEGLGDALDPRRRAPDGR